MDETIQPVAVGQSVVLSFGSSPEGLSVRIAPRAVEAARETPLQKFIYTPRIWASTIASVLVVAMLGTAVASGTIRTAPPPAPTPVPGEPTPTPDTRPKAAFGIFELVAPIVPPTATPEPQAFRNIGAPPTAPTPEPTAPPEPVCTNFLGIGCPNAPPPPPVRSQQPSAPKPGPTPQPLQLPSPEPAGDTQERALGLRRTAPPPGSNLDDALRAASIVDKNFNRALSTDLASRP